MNKKEFYETLSDEVKAKLKACKTEDEMKKSSRTRASSSPTRC